MLLDYLAIKVQSFVIFHWAVTELWDFKLSKIGQNLYANMEGFRRDSHKLCNGVYYLELSI